MSARHDLLSPDRSPDGTVTLTECAAAATRTLMAAGREADVARRDAALLARWLLGWDAGRWLTHQREAAPADLQGRLDELVGRRAAGEPIAYITGTREFYGRPFRVTPAVLIPRPETEIVVTEALAALGAPTGARGPGPFVVDVGTGSGCLAVTIALERPDARVMAIDVSPAALEVARENAAAFGVSDRVEVVEATLLPALATPPQLIVANPPYVRDAERLALATDVRDYEPGVALFAGPDGLDVIRELLPLAGRALAPDGWLVMEIGNGQAPDVSELIDATPGLTLERVCDDLQSIPRVVVVRKASS